MAKVTLESAKLHLRVDASDEDALITSMIAAAYLAIEGRIFRKIVETAPAESDGLVVVANEAINAAALLVIGHLYSNREAVTQVTTGQIAELPMGVEWLITPYVHFGGGA